MMRLLRTAHAWAGAVLCTLIAVLGVSGALLVLKEDYLRLTVPQARAGVSLTPEELGPVLNTIASQVEGEGLRYISIGASDFGLHKAVFTDGGGAYFDADGALVTRWVKNGRLEEWLFDLHHYLLAGNTGKLVAGVAGIAAFLLAITGLFIAWPSLRRFEWRLAPKSGARRDLVAYHRDIGVMFAAPVILIAFTGVAMIYSGPVKSMLHAMTLSSPSPATERPVARDGEIDWTRALVAAEDLYPGAAPRIASFPAKPGAPASVRLRQATEWHQNGRTYVLTDPASGEVLSVSNGNRLSRGDRVFNALYPLHSSGVGGRLYDVVSFLTGMVLAILGGVGAWTFVVRQSRPHRMRAAKAKASFQGS